MPDAFTRLLVWIQYLLPQHALSWLVYHATRWRWRPWKNLLIRWFVRHYRVDLDIAERRTAAEYAHFNEFFTRRLRAGVRPVTAAGEGLVSPVDGGICTLGDITQGTLVQAKGRHYRSDELLTDPVLAARFDRGAFITLYLSPRDYHRVHMPCAGRLGRMIHVPGRRFAVNCTSAAGIPRLFARNERLVNIFDTAYGPMALVMVGALCVGSLHTAWAGTLQSAGRGAVRDYDYSHLDIHLRHGEEMGRFNMGSTVILLFPAGSVCWRGELQAGDTVRMGELIGLRTED